MSTHPCDACGDPKALVGMGGTLLCRPCASDIGAEVERLHAEGKRVDVMRIARARYRSEHSGGDYLLRDVPADLLATTKHRAVDNGLPLREVILAAMRDYLGK